MRLTPLMPDAARALQEGVVPWTLAAGYTTDQLRLSARGLLERLGTRAIFLLEHEGVVIGFTAIDWDTTNADLATIAFIEIAASHRGRRLGRAALEAVMAWTEERGAHQLNAQIAPDNWPAKRLFERAGFRRIDVRPPGAFEQWKWPGDRATEAALRRRRLEVLLASPVDHADVLADVAPFYRSFEDQRSTAVRPAPHRLLRLVEAVEADRDALRQQRPARSIPELVELRYVANTLKAWADDPIGGGIVRNISDPVTYEHNVIVFAAHRLLHTWGNTPRLVPEAPEHATCDLEVPVGELVVATEVKVPQELREGRYLTRNEAADLARQQVRAAREQRRGQASFVLIVGGFQVPQPTLMQVSSALEAELELSASRTNVAGAIAMTVGRHADDLPLTVAPGTPFPGVYAQFAAQLNPDIFQMGVAARVAHNRRYSGPAAVLRYREPGVGLHLP